MPVKITSISIDTGGGDAYFEDSGTSEVEELGSECEVAELQKIESWGNSRSSRKQQRRPRQQKQRRNKQKQKQEQCNLHSYNIGSTAPPTFVSAWLVPRTKRARLSQHSYRTLLVQ